MKRLCVMLLSVLAALASQAKVYRVAPDAPGGGDGQSWATAMTYEEMRNTTLAIADEVHFKAGYYPISKGMAKSNVKVYRGGYAGTDADDEALDPTDPISVIDGQGAVDVVLTFENKINVLATNICERLEIRGARNNGVLLPNTAVSRSSYKTTVHLLSCRFVSNGWYNAKSGNVYINGFGVYLQGSKAAPETLISNCVFAGNCSANKSWRKADRGFGLYIEENSCCRIEDTLFVSNGVPMDATASFTTDAIVMKGAAFYASKSKVIANRCRFAGNRLILRDDNPGSSWKDWSDERSSFAGGIVVLYGSCGGSAFSNCVWTGNVELGAKSPFAGPLLFRLTATEDAVDVVNCTFGYNVTDSTGGAAGIKACLGTANVVNSIFYGNKVGSSCTGGRDLAVGASGVINVDWSLLSENGKGSYGESADIVRGDNLLFGNPSFATAEEDYEDLLVPTINGSKVTYSIDFSRANEFAALDCHLRSSAGYVLNSGEAGPATDVVSKAIDAGDPESDWTLEPEPNGSLINLGAYGNTAEASKTATVEPPSLDGEVKVSFVGEWTQPEISFKIAESESVMQGIVAKILVAEGEGEYQQYASVGDLSSGSSVFKRLSAYFTPGATLRVKVVLFGVGFDDQDFETEKPIVGTKPIWAGKGGDPAKIIHIRLGATGTGDGTSWTDACTNLTDALALYSETKKEFWFAAGDFPLESSLEFYANKAGGTWFRGGFTGAECSPSERPEGSLTTLDGKDEFDPVKLSLGTYQEFNLDHFRLTRGKQFGLSVWSIGQLRFYDCEIVANGNAKTGSGAVAGLYLGYSGGGGINDIIVSNCLFAANANAYKGSSFGYALNASRAKSLKVFDSVFVTNGFSIAKVPTGSMDSQSDGAAIWAEANTTFEIAGCRFAGNRAANCYKQYYSGEAAIVRTGGGAPLVVKNCAFVGNECTDIGDNAGQGCTFGGALGVSVAADKEALVENCTFAGNLADGKTLAAGITAMGSGLLKIRNSIFSGNRLGANAAFGIGRDINVKPGMTVEVDYCWFDENSMACHSAEDGGTLTLGDHRFFGNPRFISKMSDLRTVQTNWRTTYAFDSADELAALNVHLSSYRGYVDEWTGEAVKTSRTSKAIDKGDPASDWSKEPGKNGGRINLGCYGNTPYASQTYNSGFMLILRGPGEGTGTGGGDQPTPPPKPVDDTRTVLSADEFYEQADGIVLDAIENVERETKRTSA